MRDKMSPGQDSVLRVGNGRGESREGVPRPLLCSVIMAALIGAPFAMAQQNNVEEGQAALKKARAAAQTAYKANLARYKGSEDILVRPGLLADRKSRRITVWGAATALSKDAPIEFFLIPDNSGKGYEALAIAFARPSHIDEALRFIGMSPGRGVDFALLRFWPKGERAIVTVEWDEPSAREGGKTKRRQVRIEQLVLDGRTGKALPGTGLVYTGSYWREDPGTGKKIFAADVSDSKSIASTYNEPLTVLDMPYRARQGEVYELFKANPAYRFRRHQPVILTIEPEYKGGKRRVRDLVLTARAKGKGPARSLKDVAFSVADSDGAGISKGDSLASALAEFTRVLKSGQDPFVSVRFGPRLSLQAIRQLCTLLAAVQSVKGIRIEPPLQGQLFFEAFLPPKILRDRKRRVFQPWELHLTEDSGKIDATLIEIQEDWKQGAAPKLSEKRYSIRNSDHLAALIDKKDDRRRGRAIVVYAPREMTYAALVSLLRRALDKRPTVYIFLPLAPKTKKAE